MLLLLFCSFYNMAQVNPVNGAKNDGANNTQSPSPISSATSAQSAKDYDFSSLTQGMFAKQWGALGGDNPGLVIPYKNSWITDKNYLFFGPHFHLYWGCKLFVEAVPLFSFSLGDYFICMIRCYLSNKMGLDWSEWFPFRFNCVIWKNLKTPQEQCLYMHDLWNVRIITNPFVSSFLFNFQLSFI